MAYQHPDIFPVIDGVRFIPGITKDILHYFKHLPISDRDVFVVTYPKSGTTWISEIIWQIYMDGKVDYTSLAHRVPYLERWLVQHNVALDDAFLKHPEPRVFKTHLGYHQVPMVDASGSKPKYFYAARNPKDVAVSYYHHYRGLKRPQFDHSWDEFFELFVNDQVVYGSWFDHVLGWWAHRQESNILFLKYEDMKKNLPDAVQQIAKHLGKELSPEVLQRVVGQTTFTSMADSRGRFYDNDTDFGRAYRKQGNAGTQFMRKGEVGDWKNYFTEEQNKRFDEIYNQRMEGSGLELHFDG